MQAVRMRFFSGVVHGNDGSKNFRGWPAIERIRKFLTCPSGEQIQFISLRPFLDLPRAHQDFLVANVSGLPVRSEEHTSELQSRENLVCRLLLEKKKKI